ncbi:hypothetical protein KHC33_04990 [Methanospirillum sp. J.3.6.1-F.2.7.3]|uniref:DUF2225 domain-containing protein n=1 Tax=Methanospirillum purgamenti TaxID=2834276 RepID=A0A8E7AY25_9EURY|nr:MULTISPECIES: hypothetical protein [Methanospirillum]MDX8551802.1 hypothetical protein [Methanospirillum hungatei]QVV89857.1 hypothetical protein KHC33_04990 [Methanospirillum sp. J.3.6.1-F.2.7.3]
MKHSHQMTVSCAVCKAISMQDVLIINDHKDYFDTVMGFLPLARNKLLYQIHECPVCRYCAPNLTRAGNDAKNIVNSEYYLQIAHNERIPALIRRYLQYSYCVEMQNEDKNAFFGYLTTSWVCDDIKEGVLGKHCRKKAIDYLKKCKENGDQIWKDPGFYELMLADLHRRVAEFEEAEITIQSGLVKVLDPILKASLEFTALRIHRWDTLP